MNSQSDPNQTAIITVGSTSFDQLIQSTLTIPSLNSFIKSHITSLIIQHGTTPPTIPFHLISSNQPNQYSYTSTLQVTFYDFIQTIDHLLYTSKLVISHAGSGSILASLGLNFNLYQRHLIFIPNHTLMDSHQSDLIEEISKNNLGQTCELK
ncbi:family 1 glycosyltransferase [Melampsora larici-populina 98AG31]|uniref:UDP-N-acetylglucosamine transferase subunit ALG13 n=1 Tax=Melampsora larici-populina (strain 98AG31 / pathotype 3-4-7) TaxID=747676 RepID=F4R8B2_MELLP|nr:family 1 glycosyltransferase [Melampsora larici-populina 98AG31]EGG11640.1 family 1 glycosyltransferase [Melampsora larici-populina 98AG31]